MRLICRSRSQRNSTRVGWSCVGARVCTSVGARGGGGGGGGKSVSVSACGRPSSCSGLRPNLASTDQLEHEAAGISAFAGRTGKSESKSETSPRPVFLVAPTGVGPGVGDGGMWVGGEGGSQRPTGWGRAGPWCAEEETSDLCLLRPDALLLPTEEASREMGAPAAGRRRMTSSSRRRR